MKLKLLIVFSFISLTVFGQESLKNINQASFLEPERELVVNTLSWEKNRVFVQYSSPRAANLEVKVSAYASYAEKKPEIEYSISATCDNNTCRFDVDLSEIDDGLIKVVLFTDINTAEVYFTDITNLPISPILITDAFDDILLNRSFTVNTEVYIKSIQDVSPFYVYHYTSDFNPADPPSGVRRLPSKDLIPERNFTLSPGDPLILNKAGLYYIQTDPESKQGYAFRVEPPPFPSYNSLQDLKKCMIYISTTDEWKKLSGEISKTQFDQIWLGAGGNENNARTAIRNYYRDIKLSNTLFTTYKEGWKTDMGLIYAVFGAPAIIKKDLGVEMWEYEIPFRGENLQFSFQERANIFSPYHKTLIRKNGYSTIWNMSIEKLRKGVDF